METVKLLAAAFRKDHPDVHIVYLPNVGSSAAARAILSKTGHVARARKTGD